MQPELRGAGSATPAGALDAVQRAFASALRDAATDSATIELFRLDGQATARRLSIYRGNVVAAVTRALSASHPVCVQLVGDEFFAGLARAYWKSTPSISGDLGAYGATLGDFIAEFEPCASLPYLADVARLEWAVHCAGSASDGARLSLAQLAVLDAAALGDSQVEFLPGTALLRSAHPITRIWEIHQAGFDGEFEVDLEVAQSALVYRDGFAVRVIGLEPAAAVFYEALLARHSLDEALDRAAGATTAGPDRRALLVDLFQNGPLAGFAVHSPVKDIA